MLQGTLAACRRVLGSAHPDTLLVAESLQSVRAVMLTQSDSQYEYKRGRGYVAKQPTKQGVKTAARKERAAPAPLSPTALAEAEARASAAEAELLAMLDLDEPKVGAGGGSGSAARGKAKGKAKGQGGKR
jgi:hypothetical protein